MNIKYYKEYSHHLNRDMEFKVYGHSGQPILVFPCQDGRFYDFENFKMIDTVSDLIENGTIQLFCCDSIDKESWSAVNRNPRQRILSHETWYHYIVDELVPRIFQINYEVNQNHYINGIFTAGCSMGASHAANFLFRNPDIFKATIALSGYYDSNLFFGDYCDDLVYNNAPVKYINGMSYDHPYVEKYRHCKIVLCCGQGAWEGPAIETTTRMRELLAFKDIPALIDLWGHDVNHDWNWWQIQFRYFLEKLL
ncbi:MAG: alpha/beta hydrolase-fold protein [Clostridium sp.]|nr:alpha/beta hydrolase-fold protein [Clostridium sp.]